MGANESNSITVTGELVSSFQCRVLRRRRTSFRTKTNQNSFGGDFIFKTFSSLFGLNYWKIVLSCRERFVYFKREFFYTGIINRGKLPTYIENLC